MTVNDSFSGRRVCGGVRFRVRAPDLRVLACHCRECRRMSGHFFAASAAAHTDLEIDEDGALAWYQSSPNSRRGFCRECGSSLFFDHGPEWSIGIAAGAFDTDPGFRLVAHIYVDEAGKYYALADGVDQFDAAAWKRGGWEKFREG